MSSNLSELSGRQGLQNNLFEQLGRLAQETGTPNIADLEKLADDFLIGKANTYGSSSFYDFTREENRGKKVYVCNGSACLCAGTQEALTEKLSQYFEANEMGEMCCLGRCHENAAFHYQGVNYSGNDIDQITEICASKKIRSDHYEVKAIGRAVLTDTISDIDTYYHIWKTALQTSPQDLLNEINTSGLRGRGGAGFATAFKLNACRQAESQIKFIVCNADEGDPGAYSDRYLLEHQPHRVLLGMMIAGYICGAETGVLYIRAEYPESVRIIQETLRQLEEKNLLGDKILQSSFSFRFKVIQAQGAYICGEETALLSSIEGQRPEVRVRPPYPAQQGLFNKPTVVSNVETLACIPFIIEQGGAAFAAIGKGKSTGTKLVSLDGFFYRPGIYEVEMGTPLQQVIDDCGQGFTTDIKAMQIGGPLGGIVPISKMDSLSIDFESFQQGGFLLGHASIVCLPQSFPIIHYLKHLFQFTAHESCGKCFPCRIGSTRGYEMLQKAEDGTYLLDKKLLEDLLETMEIGSLCALGGGLPLPIKNTLQYFSEELSPYFTR